MKCPLSVLIKFNYLLKNKVSGVSNKKLLHLLANWAMGNYLLSILNLFFFFGWGLNSVDVYYIICILFVKVAFLLLCALVF